MSLRALVQPLITAGRRSRNRLFNLFDPPVLVLIYHRVTTLASDPQQLAVRPEHFRAQLRHLKGNFPVLRFEEDWSAVKEPAVVITFDDGYADNALEALPILEEEGVPATFFVSTGTIGSDREFWWDELERLLLSEGSYPTSLHLTFPEGELVRDTAAPAARRALYGELTASLKRLSPERREGCLKELRRWAGAGESGRASHRPLTLEELRRLAASPVASVGAHTVSHASLATLPAECQRGEIAESRRQLEEWLGRRIEVFSYPFGNRGDYTKSCLAYCTEAGFRRVAANFPGQAHRWTHRYLIPRQLVRDWPLDEFIRRIEGYWTL